MFVNFILKYWLVIIIGGVLFLMMIIGYVAKVNSLVEVKQKKPKKEKIKKEKKKKDKNKPEKEEVVEEVQTDTAESTEVMENLDEDNDLNSFLNETPVVDTNSDNTDAPVENEEPFSYDSNAIEETNSEDTPDFDALYEEQNSEVEPVEEENEDSVDDLVQEETMVEAVDTPVQEETIVETIDPEKEALLNEALNMELEDQSFEKFEELYNSVIHDKPLISDELKRYMEEFQIVPEALLDQKKEVLTDIELPTIKDKKDDEDNIWDV